MAEWRLYDEPIPPVSTAEFHADRERARHLEQPAHRPRLMKAAAFVKEAVSQVEEDPVFVSDLGCGDGGLLSLLKAPGVAAWGYDFAPANAAGWSERGVAADVLDVFGENRAQVQLGDVVVMTEVLEHLADPHGVVRWVGSSTKFFVASSPWNESPERHDSCHAWAWDHQGYRALIEQGGFKVLRHETVGAFQVVLARA